MAIVSNFKDELHPVTIEVLSQYSHEQVDRIFSFFGLMMRNFSTTFTHIYGDEPDEAFAQFAADLTLEEAHRIVEHLQEQLAFGETWPPHIASLTVYKWKPLDREVVAAKHNLCVLKKAEDRVQKYIFSAKMGELKSISESGSDREFEKLYIRAHKEVMCDYDIVISGNISKAQNPRTKMDEIIDQRIESGVKVKGKAGGVFERIAKMQSARLVS